MEREELSAWLRLQLTEGVGNASARRLLAALGLPQAIFEHTEQALARVVSANQAHALCTPPDGWAALLDATWDWSQADPDQRRVLTLGDADYPASLLELDDPPLLLYAMGAAAVWDSHVLADGARHSLAVVGSRNPTAQGAATARDMSRALAEAGLTIVSGLALGVDGAAHQGALEGASPTALATIAVVGTGLDRVYPHQHHDLAHRIAAQGLLLSEFPLGTPPAAANFPRRNRIIAGLARGTLVVEAALQSGSLITARLAVEQGKEVFAIPGSIHSTQARGCHALIKQGAKLVESAQDILEELAWGASPTVAPELGATKLDLTGSRAEVDTELRVLQALGFDPASLDTLQLRSGLDTPTLQVQLTTLELQGRISRLPGGLFQRLGSPSTT
jgi:DNA processing protein